MRSRSVALLLLAILATRTHAGDDLATKVDAFIEPYLRSNNFRGAILIARDGHVLVRKAYGLANEELGVRNTLTTKFQLASVSKPFTAAAILILEQQGKLSVDDPIAKHLPDYPRGDEITVHHLLVHRSGIPNVNSLPEYNEKSRFPQTPATLVALFRDRPLLFDPGSRFQYSNSNYNVLALLIEKASGLNYADYLRRFVLDPAGMKNSGHRGDESTLIHGRASGYVPAGRTGLANAPYLEWSAKTGNGSLYSTVEDLYLFDRALRSHTLLTPASTAKMFRDHGSGVGYGWFIDENGEVSLAGRSPGFNAFIGPSRTSDYVVILLSNNYSSVAQSLGRELYLLAAGKPYDDPLGRYDGAAAALPRDFLGEYQFGQDYVFNPGLVARVEQTPEGPVLRSSAGETFLLPVGPLQFIDRLYGGRVTFVSIDGKPTLKWRFTTEYAAQKKTP